MHSKVLWLFYSLMQKIRINIEFFLLAVQTLTGPSNPPLPFAMSNRSKATPSVM